MKEIMSKLWNTKGERPFHRLNAAVNRNRVTQFANKTPPW